MTTDFSRSVMKTNGPVCIVIVIEDCLFLVFEVFLFYMEGFRVNDLNHPLDVSVLIIFTRFNKSVIVVEFVLNLGDINPCLLQFF